MPSPEFSAATARAGRAACSRASFSASFLLDTAEKGVPAAGRPEVKIRYRYDKFTSRVIGLKVFAETDLFGVPIQVLIEAFDGTGPKASLVGGAADCEARDEKTHVVTLDPGNETPVPVLINPDFDGPEVEIRVSEAENRVVWARLKLKNAMLD